MKNGFTLAEVLITLGIISVIAALTMPTLIQNHQKHSLEVATKKFYSMMSQAVRQYMADEGVDDLRNTPLSLNEYDNDNESAAAIQMCQTFIEKYFKIAKKCDGNKCFADKYIHWNDGEIWRGQILLDDYIELGAGTSYVTADGMSVAISVDSYRPVNIYVDVNGKKGPNKIGYDFWSMSIFYDGSINSGTLNPEVRKNNSEEIRKFDFKNHCQSDYGCGCFGHFLENNFKFDY